MAVWRMDLDDLKFTPGELLTEFADRGTVSKMLLLLYNCELIVFSLEDSTHSVAGVPDNIKYLSAQ